MLGIDSNLGGVFQPVNGATGVPDMTVSPVPSSNLGSSPGQGNNGIPKAPPPQKQQDPLQSLQQLSGLGQTGSGLFKGASSAGSSLINGSTMDQGAADAYNSANGLTAGSADFASAGDTVGGLSDASAAFQSTPGLSDALAAAWAAFKSGGAVDGYAGGGNIENAPWFARREASMPSHSTAIFNPSAGAGRTDNISANVPSGAYVVPADVVSGLGEGNTMMGANVVQKMMSSGPGGTPLPVIHHGAGAPKPPGIMHQSHFANGGNADGTVPIVAAGGEMMISPQDIVRKFGSLDRGHKILDKWVVLKRKEHINTLKKLPAPKKN